MMERVIQFMGYPWKNSQFYLRGFINLMIFNFIYSITYYLLFYFLWVFHTGFNW